jgi:hypothetical protein
MQFVLLEALRVLSVDVMHWNVVFFSICTALCRYTYQTVSLPLCFLVPISVDQTLAVQVFAV